MSETSDATNFNLWTADGLKDEASSGSSLDIDSSWSDIPSSTNASSGLSTTSATIENSGANRMLAEVLLNPLRPELISILDLKSLRDQGASTGRETNSFYDYVTAKLAVRASDAATVSETIESLSTSYPDQFKSALAQYETSLAAASSEIEMLKLAYMLKQYAILGPNFRDFLEVFDWEGNVTPGVDLSLGETGESNIFPYLQMVFNISGDEDNYGRSSILFANVIEQLSYITTIGAPSTIVAVGAYSSMPPTFTEVDPNYTGVYASFANPESSNAAQINIFSKGGQSTTDSGISSTYKTSNRGFLDAERFARIEKAVYYPLSGGSKQSVNSSHQPFTQVFSAIISTNLASSYSVKQCRVTDGGYDTVLWNMLRNDGGPSARNYATEESIFKSLAGWDPYLRTRFNSNKIKEDAINLRKFLPDLTMFEDGVMGNAFEENQCYVEKHKMNYTNDAGDVTETTSIAKVVNDAFGATDGSISFNDYETIANNLEESCRKLGVTLGRMHRVGKYQNLSKAESNNVKNQEIFSEFKQTAFDAGSILASCMETFTERFANNFEKYYLWYGFQLDPDKSGDEWPRMYHATTVQDIKYFNQPDPEHIRKFASLMAYGIINSDDQSSNNSARANGLAVAKQIAGAFITDFYKGHLTFSNESEEVTEFSTYVTTNDEGMETTSVQETKFMAKVNADPLTKSPASLRGSTSGLWGVLVPPEQLTNAGGSIMKDVADFNTDTSEICISSDKLRIYGVPDGANTGGMEGSYWLHTAGYSHTFADMTLSGWMEWAPFYRPNAATRADGNVHFFTKQMIDYGDGGGSSYVIDQDAYGDGTDEGTGSVFQILNELQESVYTLASESWYDDFRSNNQPTEQKPGGNFEACNMWKYSWHWARDYYDETDVPYIPLLANLWAAEIIEMCLLTFRKILEMRGIRIGNATPADLCFPFYANTAPYSDTKGYADVIMDNVDRIEGTGCSDFPAKFCFYDRAANGSQDFATGIDWKKWVPTMHAIHENFCNDNGTLAASGKPLSEIFGHIIDNMAGLMKQSYPFFHIACVQWEGQGSTNEFTRWPILGKYGDMVDASTWTSDTGGSREKVGAPVYPRMLYPYFNAQNERSTTAVGDTISRDAKRIVDAWCQNNYSSEAAGLLTYDLDEFDVRTYERATEKWLDDAGGRGTGTVLLGYSMSLIDSFNTMEGAMNDGFITSSTDSSEVNVVAWDASLLMALTGNCSLDSYADAGSNEDGFEGRGRWYKMGSYATGDESDGQWKDTGDWAISSTSRPFWVAWWVAAVPTIISKILEQTIESTNYGSEIWPSSSSILSKLIESEASGEVDEYGYYRFGDGSLLGVSPMLSCGAAYSPYSPRHTHDSRYAIGGSNGEGAVFNTTMLANINVAMNRFWRGLILSAKEPHFKSVAFAVMEQFAKRIKDYSGTAIDAFNGDGSAKNLEPVVEYIQDLLDMGGDAGADILQNLTDQQMALKYQSFYRQRGNSSSGLIPSQEIIDSKIMAAINLMFDTNDMSKEGLRTLCFGIPAGGVAEFDASSTASNTLNSDNRYSDQNMWIGIMGYNMEYPQVNLEPQTIPFIPNLFVTAESFEDLSLEEILSYSSLSRLRHNMKFLKAELSVQEGEGESNQIVVNDEVRFGTLEELYGEDCSDRTKVAAYHILRSYLLENYYRIVLGVSINEDTFPSTSEELGLSINDYASNFAEALSGEFSSYNSGVTSAVSQVMSSLSTSVSNYNSVASGFSTNLGVAEYEDLADEILDSATNAAGSRLYTAESMRQQIIGAKKFDRVIFYPFHPDDFTVRWQTSESFEDVTSYGSEYWDGMVPYTTAETVSKLIGGGEFDSSESESDPGFVGNLDDEQWILTTGVSEVPDYLEGSVDTVLEADYANYRGFNEEELSVTITDWGTVSDTGVNFRARDGENSINFFRASVIIYDSSTLGDKS